MDNRIITIEECGCGCVIANGSMISIEHEKTFYKAVSVASKDVSAVAYTMEEAIMECVRKIRIHKENQKFNKVNKKYEKKR